MCMENFFVDLWSLKELNDIKNTCNIITDNSIPKNITNNNIPNNVTNIIGFEGVFCKLQLQTGLRCSKLVIQLLSFPNLLYKCRRAHVYVNHGKCFVRMKTSVRSNVGSSRSLLSLYSGSGFIFRRCAECYNDTTLMFRNLSKQCDENGADMDREGRKKVGRHSILSPGVVAVCLTITSVEFWSAFHTLTLSFKPSTLNFSM